jgi:hypothetical protein
VEAGACRAEEDDAGAAHVDRPVQVACGVGGPGAGRQRGCGGGARGWRVREWGQELEDT